MTAQHDADRGKLAHGKALRDGNRFRECLRKVRAINKAIESEMSTLRTWSSGRNGLT